MINETEIRPIFCDVTTPFPGLHGHSLWRARTLTRSRLGGGNGLGRRSTVGLAFSLSLPLSLCPSVLPQKKLEEAASCLSLFRSAFFCACVPPPPPPIPRPPRRMREKEEKGRGEGTCAAAADAVAVVVVVVAARTRKNDIISAVAAAEGGGRSAAAFARLNAQRWNGERV